MVMALNRMGCKQVDRFERDKKWEQTGLSEQISPPFTER